MISLLTRTYNSKPRLKKGFTLIELMVTLAIFTVISAITLANYPDFNTKIQRDILVQNIALSIREAQVYGTSIRSTSDVTPLGEATPGAYGIYVGDAGHYYLFVDTNGDNMFDPQNTATCGAVADSSDPFSINSNPECLLAYTIKSGTNRILLTCGNYIGSGNTRRTDCDAAAQNPETMQYTTNYLTNLNILFRRPNPEAVITGRPVHQEGGGICDALGTNTNIPLSAPDPYDPSLRNCRYSNVALFIGNGTDSYRKIIVWNTGQIATE